MFEEQFNALIKTKIQICIMYVTDDTFLSVIKYQINFIKGPNLIADTL